MAHRHSLNPRENLFPVRLCKRCLGIGLYEYFNTATYNTGPGVVSGRAMTWDTCDVCWGTGDEGKPGPDLRKDKSQ